MRRCWHCQYIHVVIHRGKCRNLLHIAILNISVNQGIMRLDFRSGLALSHLHISGLLILHLKQWFAPAIVDKRDFAMLY